MAARRSALVTLALALIVVVSVWPLRSRRLFSWDSANYAFAVERIDIAQHRPHPPGYLGYVFAARALLPLTRDVNAAFVAANVVMLTFAAALTAALAASAGLDAGAAVAAALLVATSPLAWFYASVAEIYVSDLVWAAAIGCAAHLAIRSRPGALYACAAAVAAAALFKPSTAALMLPAAAYAWYRSPRPGRTRSAAAFALLAVGVALVFVTVQAGWVVLTWRQFTSATANSRLLGTASPGHEVATSLNRNVRDTATALLAALGFVNAAALLVWAVVDRRRPAALDPRFAAAWAAPWLVVFVAIHIGKPGYVLPLLPILAVVLAGFYARRGPVALAALIGSELVANALYVALLAPAPAVATAVKYHDKRPLDRMRSDLEPITLATIATIADSDRRVDALLAAARDECASGRWIGVAGADAIDWRRAMYYLPSARVIRRMPEGDTPAIGQAGDFHEVTDAGAPLVSPCGLLWIGDAPPRVTTRARPRRVEGVGWIYPPGSGRVTRQTIVWDPF